jgi:hypothetical protein
MVVTMEGSEKLETSGDSLFLLHVDDCAWPVDSGGPYRRKFRDKNLRVLRAPVLNSTSSNVTPILDGNR